LEIGVFEDEEGGSLSAKFSGGRGRLPATILARIDRPVKECLELFTEFSHEETL